MSINVNLLRSKIFEKYRSQADFSREIGWDANKVSKILNSKYIPNVNDCAAITKALSLTPDDYISIFMPNLSPYGDKWSA
jgi:transcriptional regulator with XRE-family HTH domain